MSYLGLGILVLLWYLEDCLENFSLEGEGGK